MSGARRKRTRVASHHWAERNGRVECWWCGMRPHWAGARDSCSSTFAMHAGRRPTNTVDVSDVGVEPMFDSDRTAVR